MRAITRAAQVQDANRRLNSAHKLYLEGHGLANMFEESKLLLDGASFFSQLRDANKEEYDKFQRVFAKIVQVDACYFDVLLDTVEMPR
jgi:hypothetical protein